MNSARITLKNMVFYGYHGAYAAEKELGQRIEVDVEMAADFTKAGKLDDLDYTINYVDVYTIVKDIVEEGEYNLIEAIGTAIADQIGAAFDLERLTVRVRKPHPPLGGVLDTVEFEIVRVSEKS